MLDFPCFSRKGTSPIFALGRVSPSFPTFEGHFGLVQDSFVEKAPNV
jgi:hypothetical protein